MRRRWWARVLAIVFGGWFCVLSADSPLIHACPMHNAVRPAGAAMDCMPHTAHHRGPATPGHGHHHCTCLGACCGTAAAAPSVNVTLQDIVVVMVPIKGAPVLWAVYCPIAPAFARPPSTGPPYALLAG